MSDLTVSAILTSHNAPDLIGPAVESVLAQTLAPIEVLVIDDSSDHSPEVIRRYERQTGGRVRCVVVPKCNVSQARNHGIRMARGDVLAFLDGDDLWLPDKLRRQIDALAADPAAVGSHSRYFDFRHHLDDLQRHEDKTPPDDPDMEEVLVRQHLPASGLAVRRSGMGDTLFDENSGHGEDTVFAAELRLRGRWRRIDDALVAKRIHGGQVTLSPWHQIKNARTRIGWLEQRARMVDPTLDPATIRRCRRRIAQGLVGFVEHLYWSRRFDDFPAIRAAVAELCPDEMRRSAIARKRILPRWVYRIADRLRPRRPAR